MDTAERNALVVENLPLCKWLARRSSLDPDDAEQEAALKMLLMAPKFKEGGARRFGDYAAVGIRRQFAEVAYRSSYFAYVPPSSAKCVPQLRRELESGEIDWAYWQRHLGAARERALSAMRVMNAKRRDMTLEAIADREKLASEPGQESDCD